ncbi:MAG: glutamine synthetase, partial [Actinomycetota bacterium]
MSAERTSSREKLESQIRSGEIDTVSVAFPDLQGRLAGKRVTGWFFL